MKAEDRSSTAQMRRLNARAAEERAELAETFAAAGERLQPRRLASEAGDSVADMLLDSFDKAKGVARTHPLKTVGIAAMIGAFLARRPLFHLASEGLGAARQYFSDRQQQHDVATEEESEEPNGS